MPIRYEPPAPVAPGVSSAYGAAQQYSQDAGQINALRAQQLQAGIAGAQAYQAGVGNVTQRGDVAAQLLNQGELQRQAFLQEAQQNAWGQTHQSAMLDAQQNFEAQQQQRNQQAHQVLMQQQADLELSTAEQMRLQKYREADSWVDGQLGDGKTGTITPAEALEMKTRIRGMMGPLQQREIAAKLKNQEATTAHLTDMVMRQKKAEMDAAKVESMTFDERFRERPRPDVLAAVMDEMGPEPSNQFAKAFYQKEALKRVAQRGGMDGFYLDPKNGWIQVKRDKAGAGGEGAASKVPHFDSAEADRAAINEANAKYPPEIDQTTGKEKPHSAEWHQYKFEVYNREKNRSNTAQEGSPRAPQPVTRGRFGLGGGNQPPEAGQLPQNGQPQSALPRYVDQTPQQPFQIKDMTKATPEQQKLIGLWHEDYAAVHALPVAEPQKAELHAKINRAMNFLELYGSVAKMPPPVQAEYDAIQKEVATIPRVPTADERKQAERQREALRNPGTAVDWKNRFERGDLVTTDDIPGVPWLKRQF